jgi:predicted  nucleic acid-binding Zn-ribbon protein
MNPKKAPKKLVRYTPEYLAKQDAKEEKTRKAIDTEAQIDTLKAEVKALSERVSDLENRVDRIEQD